MQFVVEKGKYLIALAVTVLLCAAVRSADLPASQLKFSSLKRIKADNWNVVGQNIVVRGNVYVPFGDFEIFADQAVINVESKDIEATGNIRFLRWVNAVGNVDAAKLARLENAPNILVSVRGISGNIWGRSPSRSVPPASATICTPSGWSAIWRRGTSPLRRRGSNSRASSVARRPESASRTASLS
ncbi:MAG: hypothetical protein L6W00_15110 [Lentisphaeria bacterium]|nr:MAG: hypothetical protein L6W00_15110 [Lentisphaeria bacterium]